MDDESSDRSEITPVRDDTLSSLINQAPGKADALSNAAKQRRAASSPKTGAGHEPARKGTGFLPSGRRDLKPSDQPDPQIRIRHQAGHGGKRETAICRRTSPSVYTPLRDPHSRFLVVTQTTGSPPGSSPVRFRLFRTFPTAHQSGNALKGRDPVLRRTDHRRCGHDGKSGALSRGRPDGPPRSRSFSSGPGYSRKMPGSMNETIYNKMGNCEHLMNGSSEQSRT